MHIKLHQVLYNLLVLQLTQTTSIRGSDGFPGSFEPVSAGGALPSAGGYDPYNSYGSSPPAPSKWESLAEIVQACAQGKLSFPEYVHEASKWFKSCPSHNPQDCLPDPLTLAEITEKYSKLAGGNEEVPIIVVKGVDAKDLSHSQYATNAIQQVASQFNFLESTGPRYASPEAYVSDRSQGPQASLGCLLALLIRDYCVKYESMGNQPLFKGLSQEAYAQGYLMPYNFSEEEKQGLLLHITTNLDELRVLSQKSIPEFSFSKSPLTQVFTAAPSFQRATQPLLGSVDNDICDVLVVAQYRAVAQLAAIQSHQTDKPVNLHLTLVGQGAFNNNPDVLKNALQAVNDTLQGFNVKVFVHGYDNDSIDLIKYCLGQGVYVMPKEDFFQH